MMDTGGKFTGRLLAVDTATAVMAIAVMEQGNILAEMHRRGERNHSMFFVPAVQKLVDSLGMRLDQLSMIAVGHGPGSYTGVRIAVTAAKTMAWALNIPLLGISTLEAIAYGGRRAAPPPGTGEAWYIPLLDGRRGQAYTAVYRCRDQRWSVLAGDGIRQVDAWLEEIRSLAAGSGKKPERIVFVGETDGFKERLSSFAGNWDGNAEILNHHVRAEDIGLLAIRRWENGERDAAHAFRPNYTQLAEAEAKLQKKRILPNQ
jgi:tRNA threonylcarbamoyladenosine biosynthesis protein TsaB